MLSLGDTQLPEEPAGEGNFPRLHDPQDLLSPSIQRLPGENIPAFELKLLIAEGTAQQVEAWAADHLERDAYADLRHGGSYQTTTLYLDTPALDVFHRMPGFRRRKFRVRRYGIESKLYLERKTRWGDRVRKRRSDAPLEDMPLLAGDGTRTDWSGQWFCDRIALRGLRPACRITYDRTAFVRATPAGPLRLTLDRTIRGTPTDCWDLSPVDGEEILPGFVVCEFKFRQSLPELFRGLIEQLKLEAGSISKYRRVMTSAGIVPLPRSA